MTNAPSDDFGRFRPSEIRPPGPVAQEPGRSRRAPVSAAHGPRGFRPSPKRSWLIALVMVAIGIALLTATALAVLTYVVAPAALVRNVVIEQVKARTGRDLSVTGGASFSIWPEISVTLDTVTLSPPPGMTAPPALQAASLRASVGLFALLGGTVDVRSIELTRPVIDLRVDASGRRSWDFASPFPSRRIRYAAAGRTPPAAVANLDHLDRVSWQRITIKDGTVRYTDERTGHSEMATTVNATVGSGSFAKSVSLATEAVWQGERITTRLDIDTPRRLISGETAKLTLSLRSTLATARFNGTAQLGNRLDVKGETEIVASSFASLMRWTGTEFPNAAPLGALNVTGFIAADRASVSFGGAKLALGPTRAEGSIGIRYTTGRPFVSADLRVTELDVDRFGALLSGARTTARAAAPGLRPSVPPRSIEDILQRDGGAPAGGSVGRFSPPSTSPPATRPPQVRGYEGRAGWSTAPIDASALGAIDANARFSVAGLKVAGLAARRAVARFALTGGRARVDIDDIEFYGGRGQGVVTAAPMPQGLTLALSFSANGVAAAPLLTDLTGFSRLSGTGQLTANLTGSGASQAAIISSLGGKASLSLKDGAVAGWDVSAMVAGLKQGRLPSTEADPNQKTPFGQMTADFKTAAGVATTNNMTLTSPALRVTGTGAIDLGQRKVDMLMKPRFVDAAAAQVAGVSLAALELPFRVRGHWDKPSITLETDKIFGDDKRLKQTFRDIRQRYKGKPPEEVVRDVLGRDGGGLKKALQGLFR